MLKKIPSTIEYYASDFGKVYKLKGDGVYKEIKPFYRKTGYGVVKLKTKKGFKNFYIHRCVCLAFKENNEDKPEVNHIDGNKQNNYIDNLEWCTRKENAVHAKKNNLMKKGYSHGNAVLNKEQVEYIRNSNISGRKLAKELNVSPTTVWDVRKHKTYKESNV